MLTYKPFPTKSRQYCEITRYAISLITLFTRLVYATWVRSVRSRGWETTAVNKTPRKTSSNPTFWRHVLSIVTDFLCLVFRNTKITSEFEPTALAPFAVDLFSSVEVLSSPFLIEPTDTRRDSIYHVLFCVTTCHKTRRAFRITNKKWLLFYIAITLGTT